MFHLPYAQQIYSHPSTNQELINTDKQILRTFTPHYEERAQLDKRPPTAVEMPRTARRIMLLLLLFPFPLRLSRISPARSRYKRLNPPPPQTPHAAMPTAPRANNATASKQATQAPLHGGWCVWGVGAPRPRVTAAAGVETDDSRPVCCMCFDVSTTA